MQNRSTLRSSDDVWNERGKKEPMRSGKAFFPSLTPYTSAKYYVETLPPKEYSGAN